jgi:Aminoglycoside adenylyltransferase, C-terminal domain
VQWARTKDGTDSRVRSAYGLQWLVLGVPRLHNTIATLDITSKTWAGRYALEVAPAQWRPVLDAALAQRADKNSPLPASAGALWHDGIELAACSSRMHTA